MHTNPEVLALLALGEHVPDPADQQHLDGCRQCRDELASFTRLISSCPRSTDGPVPDAPSEAVWAGIQAELGFIPVTRSWPTMPEPTGSAAPAPIVPAQLPGRAPRSAEQNAASTEDPDPAGRRRILLALLLIGLGLLALGLGLGLAVQQ